MRKFITLKIKPNIPAMYPQSREWRASQPMPKKMASVLYASALTHDRKSKGVTFVELFYQLLNLFTTNNITGIFNGQDSVKSSCYLSQDLQLTSYYLLIPSDSVESCSTIQCLMT